MSHAKICQWKRAVVAFALIAPMSLAFGQAPPDYDFQFLTVGAPHNAPYAGANVPYRGVGQVDHEYRMSRTELTTSQWMEFVNTFTTQGLNVPFRYGPVFWGAQQDFSYHGPGVRYQLSDLPNAGQLPVAGISWRECAMFCNWLCHAKSSNPDALRTGAYDTSTFGTNPDGTFTDQLHHTPGAQYWIPTFDEAIKASHYDANRFGPGLGGYWESTNRSDQPGMPGPPGVGTTSGTWFDPVTPFGEWHIPLGSYPESVSPWGLLDTSGGAEEWTEGTTLTPLTERWSLGSSCGSGSLAFADAVQVAGSGTPGDYHSTVGLRIASDIPEPGSLVCFGIPLLFINQRRRRV